MKLKIFYLIKPILPRRFQLFLRRKYIRFISGKYKDVWPILKGSEIKPENWNGWPELKKFALILTHDVEHQKGYDKVLDIMHIEKSLGFVSSFNFIPERDYKVEKKMLNKLNENGFEFGVHGLYHYGKLFSSKKEFLRRAEKINFYLKSWSATGFRSPAMHHNLEWLLNLEIEYDLSTFDTDPFEPQPDGVGTIFPFWVYGKNDKKYLEMPYTLPMDSTLFIIFNKKDITIWKKKLDWVAENGGMALLNVHPDYINFNSNKCKTEEFPIEHYVDFLNYVKNQYNGDFWNGLPKECYSFFKQEFSRTK